MKSLADALPPEIARQIDPEWRKNEAAYWAVRDQLLGRYDRRWIGFADGRVIADGASPVAVFHAAETSGRSPFVTCVGHEDEPVRMRGASVAYDGAYPGEPLPILALEPFGDAVSGARWRIGCQSMIAASRVSKEIQKQMLRKSWHQESRS